jgi:hypothetical protein
MTRRHRTATGLVLAALWLGAPAARAEQPAEEEGREEVLSEEPAENAPDPAAPRTPGLKRRRPGSKPESEPGPEPPPLPNVPYEFLPVPDRWRLVDSLKETDVWWDPYNFNTWKADRPIFGDDWFFNFRFISDSTAEPRSFPTPVGVQGETSGGRLDAFGRDDQYLLVQNLILSLSLIQGNTTFKPPDWEFRLTGVQNWNYASVQVDGLLYADPSRGRTRYDHHFGIQEAFIDRHLANVSERYDFYSLRVGIQPFTTDFRGFLYADNNAGARLFGNWWNNRLQWNLAGFRRVEKNTNSGLNTVFDLRADDVYVANLYFQDFPVLGFTSQGTVVHNVNREGSQREHFDSNGFISRPAAFGLGKPRNYDVTYFGLNGDGHFERLNLTYSAYYGHGRNEDSPFSGNRSSIDAYFGAVEASMDFDWYRLKAYGLYASGDNDPFDDEEEGWDPIFENPNFAGADTSYWQRQAVPLVGGGIVTLTGRNALIPSLRSSKEEGQSNFTNPGLRMVGAGADLDLTPELRLLGNVSWLAFENTSSLRALRTQGRIENEIGLDVSLGILYRPLFIENVVLRVSGAMLFPDDGFQQLFDDRSDEFYSVLANLVITY